MKTEADPCERDDDFLPVFIEFIQSLTIPEKHQLLQKLQPLAQDPPLMLDAVEKFVWTLDLDEGQKRRLEAIKEQPGG